ncbi:MAG: hypothetical protein HN644_05530 [Rhodospirillales bacterium]|jgi:hypothetical protein|nr:hypothetical protein [Rhodospirillales bacterium]MBT4039892.1 hypothetical protein [Rhodospirillales bacterium]MBT4627271.1 hypothetical protein [Rhodospirillales bacterium]MBT5351234.1 hypothetical protein [Rhodospirillales bacterium]MBT5520071.1 hypothetical protein [Rhodospirillales bacterium]
MADDDSGDRDGGEVTPSELDELSHAELQMLYRESTETLRFVKNMQWRVVGSTLLTLGGMVVIASMVDADKSLTNTFMGISILLCVGVVFTLIIYQFWQHNEIMKIDAMNSHFSSLFAKVRAKKSRMEGNIHRYLLLFFMIVTVILGVTVAHLALSRIAQI